MMNIKNIFITTGISLLFGVYSISNILEYLHILNNKRENKIKHLKCLVYEKQDELQKKYNELSINYNRINEEINILNNKIMELKDNKIFNIIIPTSEQYLQNDIDNLDSIICYLSNDKLILHIETMNTYYKDIDNEFVELLSLDYDCKENEELIKNNHDLSSICNSENSYIKSSRSSRSSISSISSTNSSTTQISWSVLNLTKKFIFG